MVRRRKQLKPNGAQEDISEASVTCIDIRSPLVALPAEVQGIITSYLVQHRDLNHLCCTCKTLSAVVLPILYHTVELKIPLRWTRLPSLENLLASSSESFRYTRCLKVSPKQYRRKDGAYRNLDRTHETDNEDNFGDKDESEVETGLDDTEEEKEGVEEDEQGNNIFKFFQPGTSASNALNAFIRVLIVKLPMKQLHTFWWEHACSISTITLSLLFKRQGVSLRTLNFGQDIIDFQRADTSKLTIEGLTTLGIIELGKSGPWASELLTRNYQNLRSLRLGSELDLATEYSIKGYVDFAEVDRYKKTLSFAKVMEAKFAASKPSTPVIQLESLSLIGLDLSSFVDGLIKPVVDFDSLSILILESCGGLQTALPFLKESGAGKRKPKITLRLHTLAIRHENNTDDFLNGLESFLLSLRPLTHLHLLLEGPDAQGIEMRRVLKVHGKCLQSLVWDERLGPRNSVQLPTTELSSLNFDALELVAKYCPGLKALGISLDWADIADSKKNHKKLATSFRRLNQLQTFNVRNLPAARDSKTWLPYDYMMEGLARMLLDIVITRARIERAPALKTLAIGAATYGNVRLGMSTFTPNNTSTFLQLRIYNVDYDHRHRKSLAPTLHLIARGTSADARGNAENLDIFTLYWLDGAPRDHKVVRW